MSAGQPPPPEHILCDTSFVSAKQAAGGAPERVAHWPEQVTDRLDRAVLAISVITLAELRAGQIGANWGPDKVQRAKAVTDAYLHVPLDLEASERWAFLRATVRANGWSIGDNDLWIAATAQSRSWPLVSCDGHFSKLPDLEHIHLLRKPDSRPAT